MMKRLLTPCLLVLLFACTNSKQPKTVVALEDQNLIYWVGSSKVPCMGDGDNSCLLIQDGDSLNYDSWRQLNASIQGFEFKSGYFSKIEVLKSADDVSGEIQYELLSIIESKIDPVFQVHDIWVVESIDGESWVVDQEKLKPAQIELNVTKMLLIGSDGCNRIQGSITRLTDEEIRFGKMRSTKRACFGLDKYQRFDDNLALVRRYRRENLKLTLLDSTGVRNLLVFEKID